MSDLIERSKAVEAVNKALDKETILLRFVRKIAIDAIKEMPSAQPERKKGKWILVKGSNGKDYHKCSECLHTQDITGVKNYCAVCGADMIGEQND